MSDISMWIGHEFGSIPSAFWLLLASALLISSIGFYRTVLFISVGYAFSITAMAVITVIAFNQRLTWVSVFQNLFLLVWSVRLGWFLIRREAQPSFKQQREREQDYTKGITRRLQFLIWISVSLLYVAMFSPSLFRASAEQSNTPFGFLQPLGLAVMLGGFVLEGVADKQKSDFKAKNPKLFCNVGFYRWVRYPNYLGEILFWLGNWIVAVAFYASILQGAISFIGLICIILIMIGSTKRLERSQGERYGTLPEYQAYIRNVPVLIPFMPVYTLKNVVSI